MHSIGPQGLPVVPPHSQQELSPGTGLLDERMATLPVPTGVWGSGWCTPTKAAAAAATTAATPQPPPEIPPTAEPACLTPWPEAETPPPPRHAAMPRCDPVSPTTHHCGEPAPTAGTCSGQQITSLSGDRCCATVTRG